MVLNLVVVVLYVVNLTIRYNEAFTNEPSTLPLILSFAAFGMLVVSGHLGGKLIFHDGVAVGRHRRKTDLPKKTFTPAADADAGEGYVKIARDRDLDDGETIRAEVNGTVIVLARVEGKVHAFQEFCTHRFGPLSEGCIHEGEIECPWHRSRFDIRTGQVTSGPAKEGLRTFPVRIAGEMIAVLVGDQTGSGVPASATRS
jgi:nitrite reductase/ring-hydroxylating ferredoxin subunit